MLYRRLHCGYLRLDGASDSWAMLLELDIGMISKGTLCCETFSRRRPESL